MTGPRFSFSMATTAMAQEFVIGQGPLKKWTEHSQELHLLKIYSRGGLLLHPGAGWGLIFWTMSFYNIIPTISYQDLSNEGLKSFLSSLELVF